MRTIFIAGTDTGAGKTVFAASLVWHLRSEGAEALGVKPFCSGGRADVKLLQEMQPGALSDEDVNPFYFPEAVAPLVSERKHRRKVVLADAMQRIDTVQRKCDVLIIEGSGGLLVPLGENFMVADLIRELKCELIIAARNRLGTINHTLLTVEAAKKVRPSIKVVLMDCGDRDESTGTNFRILRQLLAPISVVEYPFLGRKIKSAPSLRRGLQRRKRILQKVLARVLE
ncbi:MAG TPA: dethiobiotin synthase [Candidatus Binatia bacterium]|nr:dethiobiotin synthase [Candidatus Binatia bacterium]